MKNIKKRFALLALAGSLLFGGSPVNGEEQEKTSPKGNAYVTRIQTDKGAGINRIETTLNGLPLNSDTYTIFEDYEDGYYGKVMLQTLPLKIGNASFGATAQRKFASFLPDSKNQLGLVGRIQGCPTKHSFGKIDVRYFPKKKEFDTYGFIDTKKIYIDILASHNLDSKKSFVLPGIDYKINPKLSVGLEASLSGTGKLDKDYIGARLKLSF
jgi:hypothetical protein